MNPCVATPESFPALVLNADFRPLSYYPLSLWSWQETVKAVICPLRRKLDKTARRVYNRSHGAPRRLGSFVCSQKEHRQWTCTDVRRS